MRIDFDDRLDKEYPEPVECKENTTDCSFDADYVCHECGTPLCTGCVTLVRDQPQLARYSFETTDESGERTREKIQAHCSSCAESHEYDVRTVGITAGAILLGLLFVYVGGLDSLVLSLLGLVAAAGGAAVLYREYHLKTDFEPEQVAGVS